MTENYLDILARTIRENWNQSALTDFYLTEDGTAQDTTRGNHYTYGEMYAEVCRVADLLTALGLQKGDHIAICGANSAHWVIAYLAIAKMQGVSVTVMHSLIPDEIANLVAFSDAKALFADQDLWSELSPMYQPSLGDVSVVLSLADWTLLSCDQSADNYDTYTIDTRKIYERYTLHSDTLTEGTQEEINHRMHRPILGDISFPSSAPDDLAMICFTSGTSSNPKGVMLSYGDLTARVIGTNEACGKLNGKNALAFLPLSHIYSFGGQMLAPIVYGGHIYLIKNFSAKTLFNVVTKVRPYSFFSVPSIINSLVENPHHKKIIPELLKGIEYLPLGGAQIPIEVESVLSLLNIPIAPAYGLSESCPISMTPYHKYKKGTVGQIFSTLECRISPAGEILVKGENVMLGYYKDPEATAQKIDKDGWLHTGDAGYMDEDGYLYVTGRIGQDIIVLPNGENIHPEDIENKLNALPEVQESIVVARDGHLVAIVRLTDYSQNTPKTPNTPNALKDIRHAILRTINPQLPDYSQLYSIDFIDKPLERTAKQTIKRYLYK